MNKTTCSHTPLAILMLAAVTLLAGCVTHWTVKDAPRRNVSFATAQAAQTFYETFLAVTHPPPNDGRHDSWDLSLVPPLPYRHVKYTTDNVRFNAAVESTDSDSDGIISESEATGYAARVKTPAIRPQSPPAE